MFVHETCEHCDVCERVTAHSRRAVSLPLVSAGLVFVAAIACAVAGDEGLVPGAFLGVVSLFIALRDRRHHWRLACERCREKHWVLARRTKPTLDGHTVIDFL